MPTRRAILSGMTAAAAATVASLARGARPEIDVRRFGAAGDGVQDDSAAIRIAQNAAADRGATLFFPPGDYRIAGWTDTGEAPVRWRGEKGSALIVHNRDLAFAPRARKLVLLDDAPRGATRLAVGDAAGVRPGALLVIGSINVVERMRNTTRLAQALLVTRATDRFIEVDRPLNFDFDRNNRVEISVFERLRPVGFTGLDLVTARGNRHRSITLTALREQLAFDRCTIRADRVDDAPRAANGVMVQASVEAAARTLVVKDCLYGYMLLDGARGCTVDGMVSSDNRHPIYPANWADSCTFRHITGVRNTATVDSHPAFDIVYQDVTALSDEDIGNIRSAGASLIRAKLRATKPTAFTIAAQAWTPEAAGIGLGRDVLMQDVTLQTPPLPAGMAPIRIDNARLATLRNVVVRPPAGPISIDARRVARVVVEGGNIRAARR